MARAKDPMGLRLHSSSDDDDEESPGESTRTSNISKVITVHDLNPQCTSTNPDLVVIFFHGIGYGKNDEWKETWTSTTSDGNRVCWPQEWLPADLAAQNVNNVRILSLSYDSVRGPNVDLSNIWKNLVENLVSKSEYEPLWEAPIVLVGYSFGGLVVKSLIVEVEKRVKTRIVNPLDTQAKRSCSKFWKNLKGIIFYGVPHGGGGEDFKQFFVWECQRLNDGNKKQIAKSGILKNIEGFKRQMTELSVDFEFAVDPALIIYAFGEGQPLMRGESVLVPFYSARYLAPTNHYMVEDATHITICQPTSQQAINYSLLKHVLAVVVEGTQGRTTPQSKHALSEQRFLNTPSQISSSFNTTVDLDNMDISVLVSFEPEHGLPCSQQNPMDRLLDYSSDDDNEEIPGESTRTSNISKAITPVHDLNPQCTSTNPELVVIFFHGIDYGKNDEWKETWTSTTSDGKRVCWPQEWLPADLATQNVNNVRILSLSYDSALLGVHEELFEIGENLVENLVSKSEYEPVWEAPIVLVGYSFGGLMVKSLVVEVDKRVNARILNRLDTRAKQSCSKFWKNLKGTIFYGVPYRGVSYRGGENDLKQFFVWECQRFNDANKKQIAKPGYLKDIRLFNTQMAHLSFTFKDCARRARNFIIYAFYEASPSRKGESVLVPYASSGTLATKNHYKVEDATHITICQPTSQQAINYSQLKGFLADVTERTRGRTSPQSADALSEQRFLNTPSQISSSSNTAVDVDNMDISLRVCFEPEHGLPCSQQNPMDHLRDYSSYNDIEESPGESTRSSYISKVENLKALLEVETQVPLVQQQLLFNGKELQNTMRLNAAGVGDDDLLMLVSARTPSSAGGPAPSDLALNPDGSAVNPIALQRHLRGDPNVMSQLQQNNPELAQAILSDDTEVLQMLLRQQHQHQVELQRRQQQELDLMNAGPFDVDPQRKIEEAI